MSRKDRQAPLCTRLRQSTSQGRDLGTSLLPSLLTSGCLYGLQDPNSLLLEDGSQVTHVEQSSLKKEGGKNNHLPNARYMLSQHPLIAYKTLEENVIVGSERASPSNTNNPCLSLPPSSHLLPQTLRF